MFDAQNLIEYNEKHAYMELHCKTDPVKIWLYNNLLFKYSQIIKQLFAVEAESYQEHTSTIC